MNPIKRWWLGTPVPSKRADGGVFMAVRWHWSARVAHKVVRAVRGIFASKVFNTALTVIGIILAYLALK